MSHKCPKCNAEIGDAVRFCPECGTAQKSRSGKKKTGKAAPEKIKKPVLLSGMNVIYLVMLASIIVVGFYGFPYVVPENNSDPHGNMQAGSQQTESPLSNPEHFQHLQENLSANPDGFRENVEMANYLYDNQRFEQALPYYRKALEINPGVPDVIVDAGVSYFNLQDYEVARQYFERALEVDGSHVNALYNMGIVSAQLGDMSGMQKYWDRLLEVAPNSNQARNARQIMDQVRDNL